MLLFFLRKLEPARGVNAGSAALRERGVRQRARASRQLESYAVTPRARRIQKVHRTTASEQRFGKNLASACDPDGNSGADQPKLNLKIVALGRML